MRIVAGSKLLTWMMLVIGSCGFIWRWEVYCYMWRWMVSLDGVCRGSLVSSVSGLIHFAHLERAGQITLFCIECVFSFSDDIFCVNSLSGRIEVNVIDDPAPISLKLTTKRASCRAAPQDVQNNSLSSQSSPIIFGKPLEETTHSDQKLTCLLDSSEI